MSEVRFDPPGPGSWMLDTAHCDRPRSQYVHDLFGRRASDGFREGFARYGVPLDTVEFAAVGPFPYAAVRPLGAPPGGGGTPPKWLFTILMSLHPAIRRRLKRAQAVIAEKPWRQDVDDFWRDLPAAEAQVAAFASEPIDAMTDAAFADHFTRLGVFMNDRMFSHFRQTPSTILPVGDFLAHVAEWTGGAPREALGVLRGHSPASVAAGRALEEAAALVGADAQARAALDASQPPHETLAALRRSSGPVGPAVGRLLDRYGDAILSGYDITELRLAELPELIVGALRARVMRPATAAPQSPGEDAAAPIRARVPAEHRRLFDELLADARLAYPLRDAHGSVDMWALGVTRRALLEAGRRLAAASKVEQPDDIFDATHDEVVALMRGAAAPTAGEVAGRARIRRTSRLADAPLLLGPEPAEPPPPEWFPPHAARLIRAFATYRALMDDPTARGDASIVRGVGASAGRSRGTARLVRSAADFGSLRQGDILVAPTTTPTYNAILPLLGGIVTDRGGLLSHPAIVSREYGFPSVVGARDATARIPDGALIEIDGDAGTVKVMTV